jgi:hypothetical protein
MSDHSKIRTGFDVEFLFGGGFILRMVQAAFITGTIPSEHQLKNSENSVIIKSIDSCTILGTPVGTEEPNIRLDLTMDLVIKIGNAGTPQYMPMRGSVFASVLFSTTTIGLLNVFGVPWSSEPPAWSDIPDDVRFELDPQTFNATLFASGISHVEFNELPGTATNPPAFAAYLNFNRNLLGLYENEMADFLSGYLLPFESLFNLKDKGDVWAYAARYDQWRDSLASRGSSPGQSPFMTAFTFATLEHARDMENWNPNDLVIKRENQPIDMVGQRAEKGSDGKVHVYDRDGAVIDPSRVEEAAGNSLFGKAMGSMVFDGIVIVDGDYRVKAKNGSVLSGDVLVEYCKRHPPRGDKSRGENFLVEGQDFVIGMSKGFMKRYEAYRWNAMTSKHKNPPLKLKGKKVGHYKGISLSWGSGVVNAGSSVEYYIDYWFDASAYAVIELTPYIDENHDLMMKSEVKDIDGDTGLLTDLIGGIIGGLIGGAVGFVAGGPVGGVIGIVAGGASGVVGVELVENAFASSSSDQAVEMAESKVGSLFQQIPKFFPLFDKPVPGENLYCHNYGANQIYEDCDVDANGMAIWGSGEVHFVNRPYVASIIGRDRREASDGSTELVSLTYRNDEITDDPARATGTVMIEDIGPRIKEMRLYRVALTPTAVYIKDSKIHSIKFTSGVDLKESEVILLLKNQYVTMKGFEVRNNGSTEYLRGKPDKEKDNNLYALQRFIPEDL